MEHQEGTASTSLREKHLKVTPANGRELGIQRCPSALCFCPLKVTAVEEDPVLIERKLPVKLCPSIPIDGNTGRGTTGAFVSHPEDTAGSPACFTGGLKSMQGGNI